MYRVVVFAAFALTAAAVNTFEDFQKCEKLLNADTIDCCSRLAVKENITEAKTDEDDEILKECSKWPEDDESCEHEKCVAKKLGYATSDGKIDKKAVQEMIETRFSVFVEQELLQKIVKSCIKEDISVYGPPDMCEFKKLGHCTELQLILSCSNWDSGSSCAKVTKLAEECEVLFP